MHFRTLINIPSQIDNECVKGNNSGKLSQFYVVKWNSTDTIDGLLVINYQKSWLEIINLDLNRQRCNTTCSLPFCFEIYNWLHSIQSPACEFIWYHEVKQIKGAIWWLHTSSKSEYDPTNESFLYTSILWRIDLIGQRSLNHIIHQNKWFLASDKTGVHMYRVVSSKFKFVANSPPPPPPPQKSYKNISF